MKEEWFGEPGHFCASDKCKFHLNTHINGFRISTIGEYYPKFSKKMEPIGYKRFYETMVFELTGDEPASWENIDFAGYNSSADANAGHANMVEKYRRIK